MHSRKSIFYKGIIFILGIFTMAIFSYTSVKAADCSVTFQDENQYVLIAGDSSKWNDSGALLVNGTGCSDIEVKSISVNGVEDKSALKFSLASTEAGHFTVGYNYSYLKSEVIEGTPVQTTVKGTIYRYIRVLNNNYETNNNYTLANFSQTGSVVASFDISNNHFANFVTTGSETYVVIKDVLGRDVTFIEIKAGVNKFIVKEVVKGSQYFYLIGNDNEGDGFLLTYNISYSEGVYSLSSVRSLENSSAVYNDGYYFGDKVYVVGKNDEGKPLIDVYTNTGSKETNHIYTDEKGEFLGVYVSSEYVYAVGYLKADNSNVKSDLFARFATTVGSNLSVVDVLKDTQNTISNTVFYDVIGYGESIAIVGETTLVDITTDGGYASNLDSRYADALLLLVSPDGTVLRNVKMVGGATNDKFTKIGQYGIDKNSNPLYFVTGYQGNESASLVYTLDSSFELSPHLTSGNSAYKVEGIITWTHGEIYYGKINPVTTNVLNMHYVGASATNETPLFVSLDTREFKKFETLNLVQDNKYKICDNDYKVTYSTGTYAPINCDPTILEPEEGSADYYKYYINTSSLGDQGRLNYQISTQTGATILIYRVIKVSEEPVPVDLNNYFTGILKWYVYNRSYTYTNENLERIETASFNYSSIVTFENMIEEYVKTGISPSNNVRGVSNTPQVGEVYHVFNKHVQNSAAFASIEYAKQFAYYLELSRVVRVEGRSVEDAGAVRYNNPSSGTGIQPGAAYYIYYIDFRGQQGVSNIVNDCNVTPTSISNCSNKGGYAFANLNDLRLVIEYFLQYNNFFVTTRNTIYNGSVDESTLAAYYQDMYTIEYLNNALIPSEENNLTINVEKGGEVIYTGVDKNVYFGGKLSGNVYTYPSITFEVSKENENDVYYVDSTGKNIVFLDDGCYKVYYTFVNASDVASEPGQAREFCVDNTAPTIIYDKDSSTINSTQKADANTGTSIDKPLFIESGFSIVGLEDIDDYVFVEVNGVRYPITCSDDSESCSEDIKNYILRRFDYNKENTKQIVSITFRDRLLNKNTFYFIVGSKSPTIQVVDQTDTEFTLVIDFFEANSITSASVLVVSQSCSGESGSACYDPAKAEILNQDQRPITQNIVDFNQALYNYILAVSYADNELAKKQVIVVEMVDDGYEIDGTIYIIENGYFVEVQGYGDSIELDNFNLFSYEEKNYQYDEMSNSILTMTIDAEGGYVPDTTIEAIPVINSIEHKNVFRFPFNDRDYKIDKIDGKLYVVPIAFRYPIENNKFEMDGVIYNYDPSANTVTYNNPDVSNLKHIELRFIRTTLTDGIIDTGKGVDIPLTEPIIVNGSQVIDPVTNQPAYRVLPEQFEHFDLVDGSYTFTINENFTPYTHKIKTDINVTDLEMALGVAKQDYENPLALTDKTSYSFELDNDDSNAIALRNLDGNDNYPLDPTTIQDSNVSSYRNTYFIDRTFYIGLKFSGLSILAIKLYSELNEYGIPSNVTSCKALVVYGSEYITSPINSSDIGCNEGVALISYSDLTNNILEVYGGKRIVNDDTEGNGINSGFFGFNREFTFYEIMFTAYELVNGDYAEVVNPITNYFYIDSVNPDDDKYLLPEVDEHGNLVKDDQSGEIVYREYTQDSISGVVYNTQGELGEYQFEKDAEGKNVLNEIVGSTYNVKFKITYNNNIENKLLLLRINDGTDAPPLCNIFELIDNGQRYETGCKTYIDLVNSSKTSYGVDLVFSLTGVYDITFMDASKNATTYSFVIDKQAPSVSVDGATDKIYNGNELEITEIMVSSEETGMVHYLSDYYTKNPTIRVKLTDLIGVMKYCYKFEMSLYNEGYTCKDVGEGETESIVMPSALITILENNKFNGDVVLYVYGIDTKNNGTPGSYDENAIKIHFWVDYDAAMAPFGEMVKDQLNLNVISNARNTDHLKTVSVLSENYEGPVMCEYNDTNQKYLFSFIDDREEKIYQFVVTCYDLHGNETGTDVYSKGAYNNIYMKFYETDDDGDRVFDVTINDYEEFNFGKTNQNFYSGQTGREGDARWIAITLVDSVGNESDVIITLPIFVEDDKKPTVEAGYKENAYIAGDFIELTPVTYNHSAMSVEYFDYNSNIYLANTSIKVRYSEPIFAVTYCYYVTSLDNYTTVNECENYSNKQYRFSDKQIDFVFSNENSETTKIYVIVVKDFATFDSLPTIVVIDRITPEIGYRENGEEDVTIKYQLGGVNSYDDRYKSDGYDEDIYTVDDQGDISSKVYVVYQQYMPKYTYNNYVRVNNNYVYRDNELPRGSGTTYYLLIEKNSALENNKECVATVNKASVEYCYVKDVQAHYYFNSLLTNEDGNKYWDSPIDSIDKNELGVYRISYYVVDAAGNVSKKIYKKVLVSDTYSPDIDLLNGGVTKYRNVTSSNDDGFQGKLNTSMTFKGLDKTLDKKDGVGLVLYKCDIANYEKEPSDSGYCDIKNQTLYADPNSTNNILRESKSISTWTLGPTDGVYKMFVYDMGGYSKTTFTSSDVYYNDSNISTSEVVYSRDVNSTYFYFAIKVGSTGANYVINGNLNTSDRTPRTLDSEKVKISYNYDTTNYYTITHNASTDRDVYLVLDNGDGTYVDISAMNAIGANSFTPDKDGENIIYTYKDAFNRVVYQVTYEPYKVSNGFFLHETYHNVNYEEKTAEVCIAINGVNPCESLETVYKVISVKANVYEDGIYNLKMCDRYGNISTDVGAFMVDNEGYYGNVNEYKPTGVNYWFSVPSEPINTTNVNKFTALNELKDGGSLNNINVLDDKFNGNFNSDYFYAFASMVQAKNYLINMYIRDINRVYALSDKTTEVYPLVGTNGAEIKQYYEEEFLTGEQVVRDRDFLDFISSIIYCTYTADRRFDDPDIKQVAYTGAEATSSMYEYVELLITRTVAAGVVTKSHTLVTDGTCLSKITDPNLQECVKVSLKIVKKGASITVVNTDKPESLHNISCKSVGGGGTPSNESIGCNVTSTLDGAIYVFIDTDNVAVGELKRYHVNEVYFGVIAYSESAEVQYTELGEFVPLSKFERYEAIDDSLPSANGRYIWLDFNYVLLDDILKTNLYSPTCNFNGQDFSDCIYVTYLPGYDREWDPNALEYKYHPADAEAISHYYNYYDGNYYNKEEAMAARGQDLTFAAGGVISNGGAYIPINKTINIITTDIDKGVNAGKYVNKKIYMELFNGSVDNANANSKLFEIEVISDTEIYSYATLKIGGVPININDKIIVNKDGTYRCIIDLPYETSYFIEITDRAGNTFSIILSHSNTIPDLEFELDNEEATDSNGSLTIYTDSTKSGIAKKDVKIYRAKKNNLGTEYVYDTYVDTACVTYLQDALDNATAKRELNLIFKNDGTGKCSGAYKIEVQDTHGNKNYIEFIFNPYTFTTNYIIDVNNNNVKSYEESYMMGQDEVTVNGVIINNGFKLEINPNIDYLVINKYDPYSNLDLSQSTSNSTITIKEFSGNVTIGSCTIVIVPPDSGNIYSVYVTGNKTTHDCDGVYTVDVYNIFADDVLAFDNLKNLLGANTDQISHRAVYADSETVEIDTTRPPVNKLDGSEQYFTLYVDEVRNDADTLTLLENKTITYTNKYITVSWGGEPLQSFTYLKYRVNPESENSEWTKVEDNVTYYYGYTSSYKFVITQEGTYNCEFMFVDAVGNEDLNEKFTIVIKIEAPKVNLFSVISGDQNNSFIVGDAYDDGERIADRTILKCIYSVGAGYNTRDCTTNDYNYNMVVNGVYFPGYSDNLELKDIISHDSPWLRGSEVRKDLELNITLTVSVKGKDDIRTVLHIIIDKKPPEISFNGTIIGTTYTGGINVVLSKDDVTNYGYILSCDVIEVGTTSDRCLIYDENNILIESEKVVAEVEVGKYIAALDNTHSGYYMVIAKDNLGNTSSKWFVLDNEAPEISVTAGNSVIAPGMYTNATAVHVDVLDKLSKQNSKFEIKFTPYDANDKEEVTYETYNSLIGLTKEGKYTLTPVDGVNKKGRSITFYIYRQTPIYAILNNPNSMSQIMFDVFKLLEEVIKDGDGYNGDHLAASQAQLAWPKYGVDEYELYAPIVSVLVDGKAYNATFTKWESGEIYLGDEIKTVGNHTIIVTDAAGNRATTMLTINNTNNVCINGKKIDVKMQAYYNVNELMIGQEDGVKYAKNDVIIFALPSEVSSGECAEEGLLGYRTLDPENSNYWMADDRTAELFNNNKYDFVASGFISKEAIEEVNNVGGTVVVLVVTKDVANKELGYNVGTNFFLEDPIGWSMIFVVCLSMIWPAVRIFVKKKVRVI